MSVTHQDVIDYIEKSYSGSNYYEVQGTRLIITSWVHFQQFKFKTLPSCMVFNKSCQLYGSNIELMPDDIVFKSSLYLNGTKIRTLPVLNIGGNLNINYTDIVLQDGTYIAGGLWSLYHLRYKHLNYLKIDGYFFSTGVLS